MKIIKDLRLVQWRHAKEQEKQSFCQTEKVRSDFSGAFIQLSSECTMYATDGAGNQAQKKQQDTKKNSLLINNGNVKRCQLLAQ